MLYIIAVNMIVISVIDKDVLITRKKVRKSGKVSVC